MARSRTTTSYGGDAWESLGHGAPGYSFLSFLDRPTIEYEEPDPAKERKHLTVRLGKRHRAMLDEISERIGVNRNRAIRKMIELTHQRVIDTTDIERQVAQQKSERRADRNRRRRLRYKKSD